MGQNKGSNPINRGEIIVSNPVPSRLVPWTAGPVAFLLASLWFMALATPAQALERILFVRHAEKLEPWPPELETFQPLNEEGEQRAEALADHLHDQGLVAVITSPTSRTVTTGMAIARQLGLPLRTDQRTLEHEHFAEMVDELKRRHARAEAVLIVGHSNTIPQWLRHLGAGDRCAEALGMAVVDHGGRSLELIDGYDGLWTVELGKPGCAAFTRRDIPLTDGDAGPAPPPEARTVVLDPTHLPMGKTTYSMRYGNEPMGVATIELKPEGDEVVLVQALDLGRAGIRRHTESRHAVTGEGLRGVEIRGPMGPSEADVEVVFAEDRLRGHSDFPRSRNKPQGRLPIDRPAPWGVYEASALSSLVAAMPIDRVSDFTLVAYQPTDDLLYEVQTETITLPSGSFEAWPVDLEDEAKGQRIWVGTESPRRVLRIELLGQGWVYDFVRSE